VGMGECVVRVGLGVCVWCGWAWDSVRGECGHGRGCVLRVGVGECEFVGECGSREGVCMRLQAVTYVCICMHVGSCIRACI